MEVILARPTLELVSGIAAAADDVFVVVEDEVGEPVLAHVLPDVLNRVQF